MPAFGIDFGTTNSVLAMVTGRNVETISLDEPPQEWAELGFDRVLPTVISETNGVIDFGWRAKRSPNKLEAVKRLFKSEDEVQVGNTRMKVEEAAGIFFRQIKERAALGGLSMDQAVVTIPANSRGVARFRTKVSAGLSGIEVLALLNEPTAAAMAYSRNIKDDQRVLVFDWGGGTLDVTILRSIEGVFVEEASKGIQQLGGIDLDSAFGAAIRSRAPSGKAIDPFDLELAKVKLSNSDSTVISFLDGGVLEIDRATLEEAIRPLVLRAGEPIEQCCNDLGGPRIDHLVLVGGTSKIPAVQRYVREMLRLDPMEGVDPMTAIAEGAALAAGILTNQVTDFDFFVATEHALGTIIYDSRTSIESFSVLIPRNTKLPASATSTYNPVYDDQESVLVRVIEGDPEQPLDHDDNVVLVEWPVQMLEKRPVADAAFDVTYRYDVDGILDVRVVDLKTGRTMMDEQLAFGAATSKQELVAIRRRIDGIETATSRSGNGSEASGTALDDVSRATIRKARDKVIPFVDDEEQTKLRDLVDALESAASDDVATARAALEHALRAHAYLL